jgi:hypothetical protein
MAAKEDLQAIDALKRTAKAFEPLVALAASADRIAALVNHED